MEGLTITRSEQETRGGTQGEYRASLSDSDHTGYLSWVQHTGPAGPVRVADHTVVPQAIGGRGVALELVKALVADAREQGFKIDPQCSYVAAQFKRHPEWADLHV